jgi:Ribosomal protein S9
LKKAVPKKTEDGEEEETETKLQLEEQEEEQATFDISELNPQLEKEIEVFKSVRKEPFFMHYLLNELRYFSDRMHDAYLSTVLNTPDVARAGDFYKHDTSLLKKTVEYDEEGVKNEPILYDGKAYGKGSRKTCSALAIVKEGTGKIRINRKDFITYFAHTSHRNMIVQPLALTANAAELDVDLFIWGGGLSAQAYAGRMAVAKALINWNPDLKKILKECKSWLILFLIV